MYQFFTKNICSADKYSTASRTAMTIPESYNFRRLIYPNIHIMDRGAAHHFAFLSEESDEKKRLRQTIFVLGVVSNQHCLRIR